MPDGCIFCCFLPFFASLKIPFGGGGGGGKEAKYLIAEALGLSSDEEDIDECDFFEADDAFLTRGNVLSSSISN
jgi:hypothetical protein